MSTILLTGANGFLGQALLEDLTANHHVVTLCRQELPAGPNRSHYRGLFSSPDDLAQLDAHSIDAVVHLAAVTGGCSESDGMRVNVEGTRILMRSLIDRGCRKFVNASSIAVVGLESPDFRPLSLPVPDEHPCLDQHGYGFSKYLMEELTRYYSRQIPSLDVINLRLAAIYPDEQPPPKVNSSKPTPWSIATLTQMSRSQAVSAFIRAVESPHRPGVRILNTTSRQSWTEGPTLELLRQWWGETSLLEPLESSENSHPALFDNSSLERELQLSL